MHRVLACLLLLPAFASAATYDRGAMIRAAVIYVSPDTKSAKLGQIERGQELVVLESSREWLHITAELGEEKTVSGWILGKGVIRASTPNGDRILYGEAIDSEDQASKRGGRKGAGQDATRLYYRTSEYFPNSPLAAEALYRAADDKWQIEKEDVMSRPSARDITSSFSICHLSSAARYRASAASGEFGKYSDVR